MQRFTSSTRFTGEREVRRFLLAPALAQIGPAQRVQVQLSQEHSATLSVALATLTLLVRPVAPVAPTPQVQPGSPGAPPGEWPEAHATTPATTTPLLGELEEF